ncbi:alpha/beta hydrolase [Chitinophaga nivalis]|uniref:Esterase family protein n=1 Tax=Chitinophaga nivalis TaxID=2991709 RepID=A0ABT3IJX5_9BACT|nr:alpha/beta hydrolase family protein [Chitinophaga nivalis]MCW3466056.1 esterase family protein [Chitinophaga nivalis]MCW3484253.1 esterase family protein [Chitinophaga nivalis]
MKQVLLAVFLCGVQWAQAAQVVRRDVFSPAMGRIIATILVVPETKTGAGFNTVYVLHGYSGNPQRTLDQDVPALKERADREQTIFVMPDGSFSSWYINSPVRKNSQYETFVGVELVKYVDTHFSTRKAATHRGLLGWSMGGYGTMLIGTQHPETFGILGSVCGALDFRTFGKDYQVNDMLGEDTLTWRPYVMVNRIAWFENNPQKLILDCGTEDPFIGMNRAFHQLLTSRGIPHEYIERQGKHDTAYWAAAMEVQLDYFKHFFEQ